MGSTTSSSQLLSFDKVPTGKFYIRVRNEGEGEDDDDDDDVDDRKKKRIYKSAK